MIRDIVRWAIGIATALVFIVMAVLIGFVIVAMVVGALAGTGAWFLFHFIDPRLFAVLRTELGIVAVTIGLATFFGVLALVFKRPS